MGKLGTTGEKNNTNLLKKTMVNMRELNRLCVDEMII